MRTTTAWATSPFLTLAPAWTSLMETTMTSPRLAYRRREPPRTLMHCTRLAPELSATSSTVRIWIMARSLLHELLDEARHGPALVAADGAMLLDFDHVAGLVLALLVVGLVAAARADVLAVEGVAAVGHHLDDDRLRHLRFDDPAHHLAAEAVRLVGRGLGLARGLRVLGHDCFASTFLVDFFFFGAASAAGAASALGASAAGEPAAPAARACSVVMTRARSRFVLRMTLVSSSRLVKFFSRFWKVS